MKTIEFKQVQRFQSNWAKIFRHINMDINKNYNKMVKTQRSKKSNERILSCIKRIGSTRTKRRAKKTGDYSKVYNKNNNIFKPRDVWNEKAKIKNINQTNYIVELEL